MDSDDAWARDTGPTFVVSGDADVSYKDRILRGINWKFNAWGGEYDGLYADWSRDDKIAIEFMKHFGCDYYNAAPFVLEGGSIHTDGEGTLLVTENCLLSKGRNPGLSKPQIEEKLKIRTGFDNLNGLSQSYRLSFYCHSPLRSTQRQREK